MPKIQYLYKTRYGISSIYPQKLGEILQNMNFSRFYRDGEANLSIVLTPTSQICSYKHIYYIFSKCAKTKGAQISAGGRL